MMVQVIGVHLALAAPVLHPIGPRDANALPVGRAAPIVACALAGHPVCVQHPHERQFVLHALDARLVFLDRDQLSLQARLEVRDQLRASWNSKGALAVIGPEVAR